MAKESKAVHDIAENIDPELLRLLQQLRDAPERDSRTASAGKTRFLLEACRLGAQRPAARPLSPRWLLQRLPGLRQVSLGRAAGLAVSLVCLVVASLVWLHAAADSLPGDTLYPLKTAVEAVQALTYGNGTRAADYHLRLAQRRVAEIEALAELGRHDDMAVAVAGYEQQVGAATDALAALDGEAARGEAAALAEALSDSLSENEAVLIAVAAEVPEQARESVDHARSVTMAGVEVARAALDGQPRDGGAADVAPTAERGPQSTKTAGAPGQSDVRTREPDDTPTPSATRSQGRPTSTPAPADAGTESGATATAVPTATADSPGKSADAPGQATKQAEAATSVAEATAVPTNTTVPTVHTPPGQATKQAETATSVPEATAVLTSTTVPTVHVPPGQATKQAAAATSAAAASQSADVATPTPVPTVVSTEAPTATAVPEVVPTPVPTTASDPTASATADTGPGKSDQAPGQQKQD